MAGMSEATEFAKSVLIGVAPATMTRSTVQVARRKAKYQHFWVQGVLQAVLLTI